jgi:hypothetical protein
MQRFKDPPSHNARQSLPPPLLLTRSTVARLKHTAYVLLYLEVTCSDGCLCYANSVRPIISNAFEILEEKIESSDGEMADEGIRVGEEQ